MVIVCKNIFVQSAKTFFHFSSHKKLIHIPTMMRVCYARDDETHLERLSQFMVLVPGLRVLALEGSQEGVSIGGVQYRGGSPIQALVFVFYCLCWHIRWSGDVSDV